MKTIFTSSSFRTFFITFVMAFSALNLTGQTKHMVSVVDYQFNPAALTITAGDTVVWTNTGAVGHNVNGTQTTFPSNPASFGRVEIGLDWTYEYVFDIVGTYEYHCDPHAANMKGSVTVNPGTAEPMTLTVNFSAMTPHVGQTLWLAVIDQANMMEIGRVKQTVTESFTIEVPGIETGKSYNVDFWADHNGNGVYNAPPADHAWRLPLTDVTENAVLDFVHNTNFTDIAWKTKLTVHFTSMTPHVGQSLTLYVKDSEMTLDTVVIEEIEGPEFDMSSWVIEPTMSYMIDFWADHNSNGTYDAPPADHAWRIMLDEVVSDTIIHFVHNTNFTDIATPDTVAVTVNFANMTPHVGQTFWLAVIDSTTKMEIGRVKQTATESFSIEVPGLLTGESYWVDFWADHNGNGVYNAPPADHAWRLMLNEVESDTTLEFVHNTTFTDIAWKTKLTVHFTAMTPHVGQTLTLYVKNLEMTLDTVIIEEVAGPEFDISSWVIEPAMSYTIDFWADHNSSGTYDAPPTDHAWRLLLDNVVSDTIIDFVHNTKFFDIAIPTPNSQLEGKLAGMRLYPNPASQYIELLIPGIQKNTRSLKVYSVAGTLIDQKVHSGNVESFRYDLSRLKNGVYFMEIYSGTQKNILKFIKQ